MNTGGEMLFPEGNEGRNVALETEAAQNAAQLERCGETELMGPPEMEMLEQQEMDKFIENSRIGDYRIVHYPPEEGPPPWSAGENPRGWANTASFAIRTQNRADMTSLPMEKENESGKENHDAL